MLQNILTVLSRLLGKELYAQARKCTFSTRSVTWCGKEYPREGIAHLPECIEGMINTNRPATGGRADSVSPRHELEVEISAATGIG